MKFQNVLHNACNIAYIKVRVFEYFRESRRMEQYVYAR